MRASKAERDATFATFMDQAGPALLRTAWFLTGDRDRAQELTQAALVKTFVVWHKIDHATALAYARRCLVNHKIDVWRSTCHEVVADFTNTGFELESACDSRSASQSWSQSPSRDSAVTTTDHRDDLVRRLTDCRSNNARSSCCGTTPTSPRLPSPRRSASLSAR